MPKDKKIFVPFITAGFPEMSWTKQLLKLLDQPAIDYIELGIPYSDPLADGPVIQYASEKALANGTNLDNIFEMLAEIKPLKHAKLIMFSYYNPLYVYGFDKFCQRCKDVGAYGVLIPDLPLEEEIEVIDLLNRYNLVLIPLIAPTSETRLQKLLENKKNGFVYCVSSMGVTGERSCFTTDLTLLVKNIKKHTNLPVLIGFGISTREQVLAMNEVADGVIVGSKIINLIRESIEKNESPQIVYNNIEKMLP